MVVAATLWTTWLTRNDVAFGKGKPSRKEIKNLISFRVQNQASTRNDKHIVHDPIWKVNPLGTIRVHTHRATTLYWIKKFDIFNYIAVADGAWDIYHKGALLGGIGGWIKNSHGKILYDFSGPIIVSKSEETKIEAILHISNIMFDKCFNGRKSIICSK